MKLVEIEETIVTWFAGIGLFFNVCLYIAVVLS